MTELSLIFQLIQVVTSRKQKKPGKPRVVADETKSIMSSLFCLGGPKPFSGGLTNASFIEMLEWRREKVFHDGDRFFAEMQKCIRHATQAIWIEVYIFELDAFGRQLLALLKDRAASGIQVRLLVDGFGSIAWDQMLVDELQLAGIEVRIYRSILRQLASLLVPWRVWKMFKWERRSRYLSRLNRRNHRKVFLIDHSKAFIGSMQCCCLSLSGVLRL
jgi:phosphatidylserine/phosphatidylglycerophosphate/cardiolipin synthase-like enzyme